METVIFNWDIDEFYNMVKSCEFDDGVIQTLNNITKDNLILEAGCGTGRVVKYLSDLGYNIEGIELGEKSVTDINQLEPSLKISVGDITDIDKPDDTYDRILSYGVIEHFIDGPDVPLLEMKRVLKPDGKLIITVPSFNKVRQSRYQKYPDDLYWKFIVGNQFYEYRMKPEEFEEVITSNGFKIEQSLPIADIDGIYHEHLSMVTHDGVKLVPSTEALGYNKHYETIPFHHNHMHLIVCSKE